MATHRRLKTLDRSVLHTTADFAGYYSTQRIGKSRRITPEGFLLLEGTPIARTGVQLYSEKEVPISAGPDGLIRVERSEQEVFAPNTLASFEGKSVTLGHPPDGVSSATWRRLSVGHAQNVRRGTGAEEDLLIADLIIKDPEAIAYVNQRLPDVSAGYLADYVETAPGAANQTNILGNHVALVERGRAGSRVAVRDSLSGGSHPMKTRDEILNARSPGKCYMSWQTWQGDVKPILDSRIDSLPALITGFTSGRTLSAEPASPDLDLGIRWVGDLTDRLGSLSSPTGDTDLSQVATELALLEREMGTRPFNHSAVLDAARRVRRASDAARRGAAQTGDADDFLTRSRLARDAALATIRAGAPRQGSTLSAAPVNPSRAVREAFAATAKPGTPAALNAAAKAFWAGR